MNKNTFQKCRLTSCLIFILALSSVQFSMPMAAFEHGNLIQTGRHFNSSTSVLRAPAVSPAAVFSNPATITVVDRTNGGPPGLGTPYPSPIAVSNLSGTITDVNITLTGWTSGRPRDMDLLLVAPSGEKFVVMSDVAGTLGCGFSNLNITLDDSAAAQLPNYDINGCPPDGPLTAGTYRPTNYTFGTEVDTFPSPAPAVPYNQAAPTGPATFASVFNGLNPNGTWNLYIVDDSLGNTPAGGTSTFSGGWSIEITTSASTAPTVTTITSSVNPSLTTQGVTFTAAVTSGGSPVTVGTVSFTQNNTAIPGCTNVAVNAAGRATCTAAAGALPEGTRTVAAVYNGTPAFGSSNANLTQVINSPTVVTGSQFCNNGGITIPDVGAAAQYPSNITVSGLVGTISKVTAQFNSLTAARPSNLDIMLVGPGGRAFMVMSDTGDAVTPVSNINLIFDDAAANQLPVNDTPLSGGTYRPTDRAVLNDSDPFPAPAPAAFTRPAPAGAGTFASVYNTINPNGNWALYAVDDGAGGGSNTIGSYCVNFTVAKFTTSTNVVSSRNPAIQGENVTFTATVITTGTGTPSGSVQFFDGATSLGIVALNGSGVATLTASSLPIGTRSITAQYLGANVGAGGGGYNASTSNTLSQVVNLPNAARLSIGGRVFSAFGQGISGARVILTDANGNVRHAISSSFGYYRFTDLNAGEAYVIGVEAKGMQFNSRPIFATQDEESFDFTEIQ